MIETVSRLRKLIALNSWSHPHINELLQSLPSLMAELSRLSRIEDKYVNLCPVLNEQAGEIIDLKEQVAAPQSREVCTVAHEDVETCGYCQRDALTRENSSMAMKLAMIATGCYRGDVQEFAGCALDPPAYQGAVTDSEDVPR